jgi:two-component system repressor protein LuxO
MQKAIKDYVPSVLVVEDSISAARLYEIHLQAMGLEVEVANTSREAIFLCQTKSFDLVLLDVELPDGSGLDIADKLSGINTRIIVITALDTAQIAIEAMKKGVFEFLVKPVDETRIKAVVKQALGDIKTSAIVKSQKVIGASDAIQVVYRMIDAAAKSDVSIFITGESGTGKELAAIAIHEQSARANETFHAINCAAIPDELMESEIFGHKKGAFSGAHFDRNGAASIADKGTLFLDEICEMSLDVQKKMLRFLQTGEYQKVGSDSKEQADVRIICATNKNPLDEVQAGRFRLDLYYRLHVIPIHLPPLRERKGDIKLIADYFLYKYSKQENKCFKAFSKEAYEQLFAYSWPGNIRELQNVIQNIVVLNNGTEVQANMLPVLFKDVDVIGSGQSPVDTAVPRSNINLANLEPNSEMFGDGKILPLRAAEKILINQAVDLCEGNIPLAAAKLGLAPSTLYRKLASEKQ